jgi:hypothetical protein
MSIALNQDKKIMSSFRGTWSIDIRQIPFLPSELRNEFHRLTIIIFKDYRPLKSRAFPSY